MNSTMILEPAEILETPESAPQILPPAPPLIRKPRLWTAFAMLFAAVIIGQLASLAAMVTVGLVTGIVMGAQGADGTQIQARVLEIVQQPLPMLLLSLVPFQLGMGAGVLFALRRRKQPIKARLGLMPPTGRVFGRLKLAALASFTLSAALLCVILTGLLFNWKTPPSPISAVLDNGSLWAITTMSILLSIIPAIVEESVFRGYLQRRLLERWSPAVAIGVSTVLFAMLHFDSLQHMLGVVPLGLVTGLLAYRTKSIKPGMFVHGLHNATLVGFGTLGNVITARYGVEAVGWFSIGAIVVLGAIGVPAVISLVRQPKRQPAVEIVTTPSIIVPVASL
jgi:uncharacterized protein